MTFESITGPIIGQGHAIQLLTKMVEKNRLPHALLFAGIDGIGRQTTAKGLALRLNCLEPMGGSACNECDSCRKMISGNHPDVIPIEPSGAFIKIDQVRSLRKRLLFAPIHGGRRVVIVNDAHNMNAEASNAMLKMLEEPPDNTHIVLTAPQTSDLLPTIVSRCQHIAFRPLHPKRIAEVLRDRRELDEDTAMAIAVLAKGSLGKALSSDTNKWMNWRKDLLERIGSISDVSIQTLFAFAEALARDKDRLQDALDVIMVWFRDLLMCKFHPEKILNRDFMEEIHRTSRGFSVDDLFEKLLAVFATQRAILRNANRRLALEVMMIRLCSTEGRDNE